MTASPNQRCDFKLIYASTQTGGIGNKGGLPWHIPEDLAYFKRMTSTPKSSPLKNVVIMGTNTWNEIKKPLPNRINIVMSRSLSGLTGAYTVTCIESLFNLLSELEYNQVFVIGGSVIYKLLFPYVSIIYHTLIQKEYECDTFWIPCLDGFEKIESNISLNHDSISYDVYSKINQGNQ